jgi:glutamyl-tRNA(Gln) amidotransferase subunit E
VVNAEEQDAVVFVADNAENASDALSAVLERAREALNGVPAETRAANADGTSRYMRPRPGAARMYPETDIPPSLITSAFLENVRSNLPEPVEKKRERLVKEFGLNEKLAKQVVESDYSSLFETIVKESGVAATMAAAFLTETLKALKRDGIEIEKVSDGQLKEIFRFVGLNELAKEASADVFTWLSKHEDKSVKEAMADLGLEMLSQEELEKLIDNAIAANQQSIKKLGKQAFGMLMGVIMKEARGKTDPNRVSKLLKTRLG